jgi:YHS domain-containing protein/thiol-disulfide isomerase/thioredoxin
MALNSAVRIPAIPTLLAVCLMACSALGATAQDQLPWAADYNQACQQASAQGKLVLLHFYSDECPPCVRVERNVFSQPEVAAAVGRNYVPVKVHALKNPALASKYHVSQWPTDVFIKPDGQEIMRSISPQTPTAYINLTNSVAASAGLGNGPSSGVNPAVATTAPPAQWVAPPAQNPAAPFGNQPNAQASWMAPSAAATAQQMQQAGQQTWQYAQGQMDQAVANTAQYAQQMQQQAMTASNQVAQNLQQQSEVAAAQAQQVVNQYAQPWQPPVAGGWQPPYNNAAPPATPDPAAVASLPPQSQFSPPQPPPAQTVPPAMAGNASPYEANPALAPQTATNVATNFPIAMNGYCPVTLVTEKKWKKGLPQYGAVHRRRTFLFASEEEQKKFLADPDKYTPVFVGYDPVKFMQTGELVDGSAAYSLTYRKQVYLFADDASLKTFWQNPSQFTEGLRQAMMRTESNHTLR